MKPFRLRAQNPPDFEEEKLKHVVFLGAAILAFGALMEASAHSGGTNSDGCHAGSKPYHCHGGGGGVSTSRAFGVIDNGAPAGDLDCADFASWEDAQSEYDQNFDDVHGLDADADGIACEGLR